MATSRAQHSTSQSTFPSLILLIATFIAIITATRFYIVEDAFISFRYAYNLAHHGVLFFNIGDPVEGVTNLLWTVLLAVVHSLFKIPIEQAALIFSLTFLFLTCLRLWQLGPMLGSTHLAGAMAAILLITSKDFLDAGTNGLEAPLFTFLLVQIIYYYCRDQYKLSYTFAGLLMLTRPEGLFFGLLLIALVYINTRSVQKSAVGVIIIGGIALAVTGFRLFSYGSLLPNSVIAKSFPFQLLPGLSGKILQYVVGFVRNNLYFVIPAIAATFSLFRIRSLREKPVEVLVFCLCGILFSFIVMVRNGTDWMLNYRLLTQYGILYAVLFIVLLGQQRLSMIFAAAFVTLPFLLAINGFFKYPPHWIPKYDPTPYVHEAMYGDVAARLAPVIKSSDTISAEAIGYISYHLIDTIFHDPFGLTNAYIARYGLPVITYGKSDFHYLVETLKPSVMVWHYAEHMKSISPEQRDYYESYCLGPCDNWNGFLVMIRADRKNDLGPAFSDWRIIDINEDWPK